LAGRLRFAHYPLRKTLAAFEFDYQPTIDRAVVSELSTLRFVEERRNVLLLGPLGGGQDPPGHRPRLGHRGRLPTCFTTASDLVVGVQSAHLEGSVSSQLRSYTGPSVLVVDELAYLPMDQASARWIFQVVSRRTSAARSC
jgi:DNA replication protein DnaC